MLAGERTELGPRGEDVFVRDGAAQLVAKLDGDGLGVAIFDGDAVAVRGDLCMRAA